MELGILGGSVAQLNNAGHVTLGGSFFYNGSVVVDMGTLAGEFVPGNDISDRSNDINDRDQVVGGSWTGKRDDFGRPIQHAYLFSDGVMHDLGTLGGGNSSAYSINSFGDVTGFADCAPSPCTGGAFIYKDGKMQALGTLGGNEGLGNSINDAGQVVGWSYISDNALDGRHAFLFTDGVMRDLGTLGGKNSEALSINNSGVAVGWSETNLVTGTQNPTVHAVIYKDSTTIDVSITLRGVPSNKAILSVGTPDSQ
jgi:probable HAF family extracellular repeat protein